jgi:flavin-dependent dehydrogenase
MSLMDDERIWLGERNFLMVGDAAGLIDPTRGVGMDAAALSGRLAAKAIGLSRAGGEPVSAVYAKLMKNLVNQTRRNQQRGIISLKTNEELQSYLDKGSLKLGLNLPIQTFFNRFRSGERQVLLP